MNACELPQSCAQLITYWPGWVGVNSFGRLQKSLYDYARSRGLADEDTDPDAPPRRQPERAR